MSSAATRQQRRPVIFENLQDVALAPMEGVTDFPTRLWFALTSAPACSSSPFLRITQTFPAVDFTPAQYWPELGCSAEALPYKLIPQVMASSLDDFLRTAERVLETQETVELNCGCPAPTVVGHNAGSSLLRDPALFGHWLRQAEHRLGPGRLRIKMRTGFQSASEFDRLLEELQTVSLRALTVHGRTRVDQYRGKAKWQLIEQAARTLPYPVIGSGDINSFGDLDRVRINAPSVGQIIIGRGALRNPWLFEEIRQRETVRISKTSLLLALRCYVLLQQMQTEVPDQLRALASGGLFSRPCGTEVEAWKHVHEALNSDAALEPTTRGLLGRTKMMWNYVRTSIGAEAMEPSVFRLKTIDGFFVGLEQLLPVEVSLRYHDAYDFIFSGERNPS